MLAGNPACLHVKTKEWSFTKMPELPAGPTFLKFSSHLMECENKMSQKIGDKFQK